MGKYYRLIGNGEYVGGVAYSPDDFMMFQSLPEGGKVENWSVPTFILKNGEYRDYLANDTFKHLCSGEIKDLLESMKSESDHVQWLEVKIFSEEYGDRSYYVLHIPKFFDVLNKEKTMYAAPHHVIKPVLRPDNLAAHKIFGYEGGGRNVVMSEDVKKALEKIKGIKNQIYFSELKVI